MDGPNKGDGPQADELDKGEHIMLMWHPPGFSDLQGILNGNKLRLTINPSL